MNKILAHKKNEASPPLRVKWLVPGKKSTEKYA